MSQALSVKRPACRVQTYSGQQPDQSVRLHNGGDRERSAGLQSQQLATTLIGKRSDGHPTEVGAVIAQTSFDRVDYIRSLTVNVAPQSDLVISEILRSSPGHGMTEPYQRAHSYAACIHLNDLNDCNVLRDDREVFSGSIKTAAVHIGDMRNSWRADIKSSFHVANFYIPQNALDTITREHGVTGVEALNCDIATPQIDTVFKNLTLALLPAIKKPEQANRLFVDYAARAVLLHLVRSYGSPHSYGRSDGGGLAPWQERRAKELLVADLSGNLTLQDLASACRLSTSHFSSAFRKTVGCPPHQWLIAQRVERAKQLLLNTTLSLSEIALSTGFSDQSHFTRVFAQRVKASPGAWRRVHRR